MGDSTIHRLHVSVLEEVPRVRQSGTLQFQRLDWFVKLHTMRRVA